MPRRSRSAAPGTGAGGRPLGHRLRHPGGGRPLLVLGRYEGRRCCGGCDTIRLEDGGRDETFRLAGLWAGAGYDVLVEGAALSVEHERSAALARRHRLHVLRLATPPGQAVRNLAARRHLGRAAWPGLARAVAAQGASVEAACDRLRAEGAVAEALDAEAALRRALVLLGLSSWGAEGGAAAAPAGHPGRPSQPE